MISLLFLCLPFVYIIYKFIPPKHLRDIPTVPTLPFIFSFIKREPSDKRTERLIAPLIYKYGYAKFWFNGWKVVFADIETSKEILNNTVLFHKNSLFLSSPHSLGTKLFGNNIIFASGDEWKRHRKIANPAFHRSWNTELVGKCCEPLIDILAKSSEPVDILTWLKRMTLDALGKAVFDFDFKAVEDPTGKYATLYYDVTDNLGGALYFLFPFLENPIFGIRNKAHAKAATFRNLIREVLTEKKKLLQNGTILKEEEMDLLSLMVKATIESKTEDNSVLSEEEVINDAAIFFGAGHDTTANTLAYVLYYLSTYPEVQAKAREEVRRVMNGTQGIPTHSHLKELHYITALIHEVMRIKPIVHQLFRISKEPVRLNSELVIPANQEVSINIYTMLHDEKYWKNPKEFNPERFLKYSIDENGLEFQEFNKAATKAWIPFGGGPRTCIGMSFSLLEQRILLVMILNRFKISLPKDSPHLNDPISVGSPIILQPIDLKLLFQEL